MHVILVPWVGVHFCEHDRSHVRGALMLGIAFRMPRFKAHLNTKLASLNDAYGCIYVQT